LSQSKLPGYILPAVPAWSILAAQFLARVRERGHLGTGALAVHALVVAGCVGAAFLSPYAILAHPIFTAPPSAITTAGLFAGGFFLVIWFGVRARGVGILRFLTSAAAILCVAYLLRVVAPATDASLSARSLTRFIGQMSNAPSVLATDDVP